VQLSSFLGRDDEQARLVELVITSPLVTVTGAGGIGKTRLVREAVKDLSARVTDDVVFAELALLSPGADVGEINGEIGFSSPEAAAVALTGRSALLVLDNCEHVLDAVADFVARFLVASDSARVVATSREPLGVEGEHVMPLRPLDVPAGDVDVRGAAAVQLFLDRSASAGAAWDETPELLASVSELCRRLDGLPLAIELAAARTRAMTPADILMNIDSRLELLRRPALRGLSARHNSIRAAIDTSIDLLDDDERRAFRRLGAFAGPFGAGSAETLIAGDDRLESLDRLTQLVDRSLVVAEQVGPLTQYRLLELLRDHAREALVAAGEWDAVHERFVEAMVAAADDIVASGLSGWSAELVARIASEYHNLGSAIDWCIEHDPGSERAVRLYLPLFSSIHQSRSREVLDIGRRIFDRWPDGPGAGRAEALAVLATAAVVAGDIDRALVLAQASRDDPDGTAIARMVAHRASGFATRARRDYEAAATHFAAGLAEAKGLGAVSYARELTGFVAAVRDLEGDGAGALEILDGALDEVVQADDPINEAWLRLVKSTVLMRANRWEEAEQETAQAQATAESLLYPWWEGAVLRQLAILAAYQASLRGMSGGWAASVAAWRAAVENAAARGSTGEVALTLRAAAAVALKLGEDQVSRELMAAVPTTLELTVMADLFPEEARRLEAEVVHDAIPPDLPEALRRARAILVEETTPATSEATDARPPTYPAALIREADGWEVIYAGRSVRVRNLKGLLDLARLLPRPGVEVHCLELMGGVDVGDAGPQLDEQARKQYQRRIEELQREIDEASADNDSARGERAELELDALVEQLSDAFGLGGRSRSAKSSVERARTAVTYRIRAAIKRLDEVHPELGRHLTNAVRTGTWCSYQPETDVSWEIATD
jgi:predicted ATPase